MTAKQRKITPALRTHPLATQAGIALLANLIEADRVWTGCTKPQRALLSDVCPPVAERLIRDGKLTTADMPVMWGECGISTLRALQRRGLVDEEGRLTATAIHAWYYKVKFGAAKDDKAATT